MYALALVAYQCLTGSLPFDTSTPERTMTARLTESPQGLSVVRPEVAWPAAVQAVFDKGLARDREARHDSAGAFARALAEAVEAWTTGKAAASPPPNRSVTSSGTNDRASAPSVARPTVPSEARREGSNRGVLIGGAVVVGIAALAFVLLRGGEEASVPSVSGGLPAVTQQPADQNRTADAEVSGTPSESPDRVVAGEDVGTPPSPAGSTGPTASAQRPAQTATADPAPLAAAPPTVEPRRTSAAALFTLDSIRLSVDMATATAADGRRSLIVLRDLMPRLATAEDSAWGYIRQAEAQFLMEDRRSACLTLATALPLLRTQAQRNAHTNLSPFC